MKVYRLAWSEYESETGLDREERTIREHGWSYGRSRTSGEVPEDLADNDVLLVNSQCPVTSSLLERWGSGGLIVTLTNGYDHVDLGACQSHDVTVARTPLARAARVTDHTLACILSLARRLPAATLQMRRGSWTRTRVSRHSKEVSSLRVGLVGYGVIGRRVAERVHPRVEPPIFISDPERRDTIQKDDRFEYCTRDELLDAVDLVSLHPDLNPTTRDYLDRAALSRLSDHALVINTARGEMVVTEALMHQLESGHLGGAALDVFRSEPPDPPLLDAMAEIDNLILTPHSAGFGGDLLADVRDELLRTLEAYHAGDPLPHPVPQPSDRTRNEPS